MSSSSNTSHHRRASMQGTMSAAQMDAVGRLDDSGVPEASRTEEERLNNAANKLKHTPPPSPPPSALSPLEIMQGDIEVGRPVTDAVEKDGETIAVGVSMDVQLDEDEMDDVDVNDLDEDIERLLGTSTTESNAPTSHSTSHSRGTCCRPRCYPIGNDTVVCPMLYERTGLGIVGPHWIGPMCTLALLLWASHYFTKKAAQIGTISFLFCIIFTIIASCCLFLVAFGDPGIITRRTQQHTLPRDEGDLVDWRWCDLCSVYQPPDAAHCPECNICVEGYDHHCVWMGTCVGRKNFRAFMMFNMSWLFYLMYAIVWVTVLGPKMYG